MYFLIFVKKNCSTFSLFWCVPNNWSQIVMYLLLRMLIYKIYALERFFSSEHLPIMYVRINWYWHHLGSKIISCVHITIFNFFFFFFLYFILILILLFVARLKKRVYCQKSSVTFILFTKLRWIILYSIKTFVNKTQDFIHLKIQCFSFAIFLYCD